MEPLWEDLNEEERTRNEMGDDVLFVGMENRLYDDLGEAFYAMKQDVNVPHTPFGLLMIDDASKSKVVETFNWRSVEGWNVYSPWNLCVPTQIINIPLHRK